ncbi:hypothetical protein [Bryobacter aggregatus]|uniref:hypothetical protein n=1 Tax=Bryobacter aggregatus TaxID=360054 RepID=UPI00138E0655|nr:hypothetical protein [Bryobacter aggregatus]
MSHPLSRASILLGRFLGCMVLAAGSLVYTFLGAWLVTGLKVNLWHWPFFFGILTTLLLYCSLFGGHGCRFTCCLHRPP